jgi:HK97 family phage portal protein
MHLANFSFDGLIGIAPLTLFRETLGLTIAANDYTASYFKKGGRPLGFLTKPNVITKAQRDSLRGEWQELHGGADNSHNVGILSGGLDWKNIGLTNNDAQLLGLRQFQRYLVAELMRVPPFLLGDVEQTLTSLEFVQLQFIIFTMLPIMRRWEQEMNRVMFTPKEKFTYFMEHDPEAMLRGDQKTMAEVDQTLIRNGITLINEARRRRNRKGVEYGDTPLVMASQMATLKDVATGVANLKTTTPGADKSAQPDTPTAKYVNRITKAYKNLDEVNRKKVLGMLVSMNGVGTHPLQT